MKGKQLNKGREITKTTLNIISPIASALSLVNPALLSIPVIASVSNELCAYFDTKSVEKRLLEFQKKLEEHSITIERLKDCVNQLSEHSQYVFRNNMKHLCLEALPETTEALITCLISYLMGDKQDMDEEICEIICSCNANDILLLQLLKYYIAEGTRAYHCEMIEKAQRDDKDINGQVESSEGGEQKRYIAKKWYDRNIIYGENTIFWKDFSEFYKLQNVNDMGKMLNMTGWAESGTEVYDWAYIVRSLLKFQREGVVQLEFVSTLGVISQNNIDRFHITIFGQNLLNYIKVEAH